VSDLASDATAATGHSNDDQGSSGRPLRSLSQARVTLALLGAVFAVHFLDRQILAILISPIKAELGLSDTALALLSGFAFIVVFSTVGLVVARLADRSNRARIIVVSLALFSVMTALCGFVNGFWQLLAARIGVGFGEGGTNPASHALIADLFPTQQRAAAMAAYSVGPHLGLVLAFGLGGWLGHTVGWRATFMIVGAIGLVLAVVTGVALRDPRSALAVSGQTPRSPAKEVVRSLLRSPAQRHLFAAATLATAAALGAITWLPAMLVRAHDMSLAAAGIFLALTFGVAGAAGTYAFGTLADALSVANARRKALVTGACQVVLAMLWLPAVLTADRTLALVAATFPCALTGAYLGPTLAMVQDGIDPRARAFSAAVLLLVINLVGAGAGPLAVGALSDALSTWAGERSLSYALLAVPALLVWSAWHFARAVSASTGADGISADGGNRSRERSIATVIRP
jgi:predicted MFS family arabinose efflux permease